MTTNNSKVMVSVIIPAFNEEEHIERALKSIESQDYENNLIEVIVIDNNSNDQTRNIAEKFPIKIELLIDGPVGKVRNRGAQIAQGDILFFLDADCIAPNNWISYAVENIRVNPNLVLGGGYNLRAEPKAIEKYWILDGPEGSALPKDLLGGCIALTKSAFLSIGGFDEKITSGEDSKLSQDLEKAGYTVRIDRAMSVIHLGNPTSPKAFLERQIWHSENYFKNPRESLKDKTFLLIFTFTISTLATPMVAISSLRLSALLLLFSATLPLTFSLKRIKRSKNRKHLMNLHRIYILDLLYSVGRSLGLVKSLAHRVKKRKQTQKTDD